MYPNVDTGSLANYYLASKQAERASEELISELRTILQLILISPRWMSIGSINNMAELSISRELYERAAALAWGDE